jgi:ParB family transcriptional regulator, chromosome partitioning protein
MFRKEDVMATTTQTYEPNRLYEMPLGDLQPDPNQPRKYIDPAALEELVASIREHKVIAPILFRVENGLNYIVAGERRWIAARKAGLTTIPAIYTENPRYEEIALTESTIRADLTAVEEAEALDRLQKSKGYKQEELAQIMGRSVPTISQTLSLIKLPRTIRDECRKDPGVPRRVLYEIAAKKQERSMLKAYEAYKASVNPDKKEQTGNDVTKVQRALQAVEAAQKKIGALEAGELYVEEKEALVPALKGLKGVIETLLAAIAESEEEDETSDDTTPDGMSAGEPSPEAAPPTTKKKKKTLA